MVDSRIRPIVADVSSGRKTASQYVEAALTAIEKQQDYNAVISTTAERARARAAAIDAEIKAGKPHGRLAGVPFIAKDNFLAFGAPTTAASTMLKNFSAPFQATAIERLEAEGAVCVGKANLDAFAHGGSTEHSDFGPTLNPHDKRRVPGGSSGGSAAAVALDIVPFALGTDTGGSIRLPAAYCGVVGLKPTYGRVSRFGVVAMASSTDTIGPLTHTVADAELVLDIMAGPDERDATTIARAAAPAAQRPLSIGLLAEGMSDMVEPATRDLLEQRVAQLRAAGHSVETVSLPSLDLALAVYYVVVPAEISSNLARYDGIRFGYHDRAARDLAETYQANRTGGFNDENKRRIMIGNYVLSSGYYDAYFKRAQTVRTIIINEFKAAFDKYDLLLSPVAPGAAFELGAKADPLAMYLVDIMTVGPSLAGLPAISLPAGTVDNLPVGLQIIGRYGDEPTVLRLAAELEAA